MYLDTDDGLDKGREQDMSAADHLKTRSESMVKGKKQHITCPCTKEAATKHAV